MAHYRITAHGRAYFTDATDIASALLFFKQNVEGIATETLIEIGGLINQQTGQTFGVTVHPPAKRKAARKAAR